MQPQTFVGRRRLAILRRLAASTPGLTVPVLSKRLGLCLTTIRTHLQALEGLGLVTRLNYRRWQLAPGTTLGSLDGSRLDSQEESHASHR